MGSTDHEEVAPQPSAQSRVAPYALAMASSSDEWAVYQDRVPPTEAEWQRFVAATPIGSIVSGVVLSVHQVGSFLDIGYGTSITGIVEVTRIGPPGADSSPPVGSMVA